MTKIVFVVGAGASADFGLPLGKALAEQIRATLCGELNDINNRPIIDAAMRTGAGGNFGAAVEDIAGGLLAARSIDRLLETRKSRPLVAEVGKRAIAAVLSQAETRSSLARACATEWQTVHDAMLNCISTWLAKLFGLLSAGHSPEDSSGIFDGVSFVTFNYDRCIEMYLRAAFEHIMNLPKEQAEDLAAAIPVVHIYGSLGDLPTSAGGVPFGPDLDRMDEMASSIRTYTEAADEQILRSAHELIDQAERIIFLGFGFDPLNVSALFPQPVRNDQPIMGTRLGLEEIEVDNFRALALTSGPRKFGLYNQDCASLIDTVDFRTFIER